MHLPHALHAKSHDISEVGRHTCLVTLFLWDAILPWSRCAFCGGFFLLLCSSASRDDQMSASATLLQGDSGFALFRKGARIFESKPLQHFFDCPYQFASCPDFTEDTDRPEDASEYELQLQSGDVIIAATDGLWDNLHTEELLPLLPTSEDSVKQVRLLHIDHFWVCCTCCLIDYSHCSHSFRLGWLLTGKRCAQQRICCGNVRFTCAGCYLTLSSSQLTVPMQHDATSHSPCNGVFCYGDFAWQG